MMLIKKYKKNVILSVILILSLLAAPIKWVDAYEPPEVSSPDEISDQSAAPVWLSDESVSTDEIIVVYNDAGLSDSKAEKVKEEAEEVLAENDIEVVEELVEANEQLGTVVTAEIPEDMTVEEAVKQAMQEDTVDFAQPNFKYSLLENEEIAPQSATNDPLVKDGKVYYLDSTGTTKAWETVKTQKQVTVAVIDTGCRLTHEDLKNNILTEYAYDAYYDEPLTSSSAPNGGDPGGHGTHVAGLVAAQADNSLGVAGTSYNANIIPIKIFDNDADNATTIEILRAFEYIRKLVEEGKVKNLHVINMSLGYYADGMDEADIATEKCIKNLADSYDILSVCAGGNGDGKGNPITSPMYPSDFEECLSVTSLAKDGTVSTWADYNPAKDISAPGEEIASTYKGSDSSYAYLTGTSMATPIVSGICALLWAADPTLSVDEVKEAIEMTALPVQGLQKDNGSHGAIDANRALAYVKNGGDIYSLPDSTEDKLPAEKKNISACKISLSTTSYTYNNKEKKPKVTVKNGSVTLTSADYTVTYSKNKKVGTATVKITGKGTYTGTGKKTFKINPKGTSISKLTKKSKGFTVKWKKQKTQTTGYQIQYSLKKNFKNAKSVWVKNTKTTSKSVSKLKKNKKYYVRIRTYKKVDGKKYYSGWSKVKSVKTK